MSCRDYLWLDLLLIKVYAAVSAKPVSITHITIIAYISYVSAALAKLTEGIAAWAF
ncbi:hypothetical protein [Nostoc flagelliforme]|uniref:hypothetical protein n=1 Tax=Nostoc flagelliforme TaxID=1306274 RepID=UPI0030DBAF9F